MAFLRLVRVNNLFIIFLTMMGIWWSITHNQEGFAAYIDYFLVILFTLLIAAAGNVINDYFDIKSDRLNKPEKMIVTKKIKKRWAIVIHWGLNAFALCLSIYLTWKFNSIFYILIHLFSTLILWCYSLFIKRWLFWSNFTIAFLIALTIFVSLKALNTYVHHFDKIIIYYFFAGFAFLINLAREILKDVEDMEGDKLRNVQSIALVYGVSKARTIAVIILITYIPVLLVGSLTLQMPSDLRFTSFFYSSVAISIMAALLLVLGKQEKKINQLLKISMAVGVVSIYFV